MKNFWKWLGIVIFVGGISYGIYYVGFKQFRFCNEETGQCGTPELIGGQTDEHGCLGPAGYSWCEAKQKCLRVWEEKCEATSTTQTSNSQTFDWNTYKNEKYGFELRYPTDFSVYANSYYKDGIERYNNTLRISLGNESYIAVGKENLTGQGNSAASFTFSVEKNTEHTTIDQLYDDSLKEIKSRTSPAISKFKVASGENIIEIIYPDSKTIFFLIKDDKKFTILADGSTSKPITLENREMIVKILKTLSFSTN